MPITSVQELVRKNFWNPIDKTDSGQEKTFAESIPVISGVAGAEKPMSEFSWKNVCSEDVTEIEEVWAKISKMPR